MKLETIDLSHLDNRIETIENMKSMLESKEMLEIMEYNVPQYVRFQGEIYMFYLSDDKSDKSKKTLKYFKPISC